MSTQPLLLYDRLLYLLIYLNHIRLYKTPSYHSHTLYHYNTLDHYNTIDHYILLEIRNITTGVPQGSNLRPFLFIIYINDIANASKLFNFIIYADDTTLETTIEMVIRESNNISIEDKIGNELYIYNSLILSHLNFGILAWGYHCDRIYKAQKRRLSVLFASANIMHILSLYLNLSTY